MAKVADIPERMGTFLLDGYKGAVYIESSSEIIKRRKEKE